MSISPTMQNDINQDNATIVDEVMFWAISAWYQADRAHLKHFLFRDYQTYIVK